MMSPAVSAPGTLTAVHQKIGSPGAHVLDVMAKVQSNAWLIAWTMFVVTLHFWIGLLWISQSVSIARNITTNEEANSDRYEYLTKGSVAPETTEGAPSLLGYPSVSVLSKKKEFSNVFDDGCVSNCSHFLRQESVREFGMRPDWRKSTVRSAPKEEKRDSRILDV